MIPALPTLETGMLRNPEGSYCTPPLKSPPLPLLWCSQAPVMADQDEFKRARAAGEASDHPFRDVPKAAFPLLLSSQTW